MFVVITGLIVYSLLTFGAVMPHNWFLLGILWCGAAVIWIVTDLIRGRELAPGFVVGAVVAALLFWLVQARLTTAIFAAVFAWYATKRNPKGLLPFLKVLVVIGVLEALLGLTQFLILPGWIFGYINVASRSSGTLINRNHFAGLLELLIPVAFGMAYMSARRFNDVARPYVFLLAGAFMGIALLFSLSRMGIISFLITLCFLGILLQWRKSQRGLAVALSLGMVALVSAAAFWIGVDEIVQRYSELTGDDALFREGRIVVFRDTARMIMDNPLGVGVGKFQDRFRQYQTFRPDLSFDHAHNDYLETAAEWGVPIAIVFWTLLFLAFIRAVRMFLSIHSPEQRGILLACVGAMFSIAVHSLMDFNLQIPSNAMLFFIFVGISVAMPLAESPVHSR